ncbi:MAG: hypothetical protein AAGF23_01990 [Acidobacteriota bacterium]
MIFSSSPDHSGWWPLINHHLKAAGLEEGPDHGAIPDLLRSFDDDTLVALEYRLRDHDPESPDVSFKLTSSVQKLNVAQHLSDDSLADWFRRQARVVPAAASTPVWLEFDALGGTGFGAPLVCLTLPEAVDDVASWALRLPGSVTATQRKLLARCQAALPRAARAMYLFDLSPRRAGWIRLEVFGISAALAPAYMGRIGALVPDGLDEVAAWLEGGQKPHFSIDMGPDGELSERVGFEISFAKQPPREDRWRLLFDRLETEGLCHPRRSEAMLGFTGQDRRATAWDLWPAEPGRRRRRVARVLSHVKIANKAGGGWEAKAYLLFQALGAGPVA